MLIDSRLKASGSSNVVDVSAVFDGLGERNDRLVPPLRAKSKFDGMFCKDSRISSSSRLTLIVDVVWGSRLYCDIIT